MLFGNESDFDWLIEGSKELMSDTRTVTINVPSALLIAPARLRRYNPESIGDIRQAVLSVMGSSCVDLKDGGTGCQNYKSITLPSDSMLLFCTLATLGRMVVDAAAKQAKEESGG